MPVDGDLAFLRDPASGLCMPVPAGDRGGGSGEVAPWAGWEKCTNPCAGLDEPTCSADPRCKSRFDPKMCPAGAACAPAEFIACDPNPPDACIGLDAQICSATPGCEAIYGGVPCDCADGSKMCACPDIAVYRGCHQVAIAASCQGDDECGGGRHCSTREGDCRPHPLCGEGRDCPAVCTGVCVADDEPPPSCTSDVDCGPNAHCSVSDGKCALPPGCDEGDVCAAVCYGMCVPDDSSCFALGSEKTCVLRSDCEPVYRGTRCFCDAQGCGCLDYTFDTCRPRPTSPQSCDPAVDWPTGITGTWAGDARRYTFTAQGGFTVEDDVAPCPPEAVCVWSGVVTNHGTFTLDASGTIALRYVEPIVKWEGLVLATQLALKDCSKLVELPGGGVFNRK